ncbi:MAG: glutathione peroxidase [Proteobacteria bacterium]|nr:glutathione peroxidase [Pseudomonadota bacterium]
MSLYELTVKDARGQDVPLSNYKGKALLVVNTASACGFTPQYEGLQEIYQKFQARGLEILGFPCNQFGAQEPGTDAEIQDFCTGRFSVTFPVFAKIEVNGPGAHPLYQWLKKQAPGILGTEAIKWNFTKFLVSADGRVLKRFAPTDTPGSIAPEVEKALGGA